MMARVRAVAGKGQPVVYVPGIDGTGELLLETGPRLAESFRLIRLAYEAERPEPAGGDRYEGLARSIVDRLDELGVERAILLAESFGGAVALRVALDHAARVSGLLVVNSFVHYSARLRILFSTLTAPLVPDPMFHLGRRLLAARLLFGPRRGSESFRAFQDLSGVAFDDGYCRRLRMIRRLDLRPNLPAIRMPVALYASDSDRIVPSVREMSLMAERLPDATFEVLEGMGHLVLPMIEEPWTERLQALAGRIAQPSVATTGA